MIFRENEFQSLEQFPIYSVVNLKTTGFKVHRRFSLDWRHCTFKFISENTNVLNRIFTIYELRHFWALKKYDCRDFADCKYILASYREHARGPRGVKFLIETHWIRNAQIGCWVYSTVNKHYILFERASINDVDSWGGRIKKTAYTWHETLT